MQTLQSRPDPYGFKRTSKSSQKSSRIPRNILSFSRKNFREEVKRIRFGSRKYYSIGNSNTTELEKLTLSNEGIWERGKKSEQVECSLALKSVYVFLCAMIDIVYKGRPIQRFWFLEVVARMPYISYVCMLHLYETMGWWTVDDGLREQHFREDRNESIHLLVMESLGGSVRWRDRFLARHCAILYFWTLILFYFVTPKTAYKSSELLERHAVDTYLQFVHENEEILSKLPVPDVSIEHYGESIYNLRQLFWIISSEEARHAASMKELTSSHPEP